MKKLIYALGVLLVSCSCINITVGGGNGIRCKGPVVEKTMEGLTDFTGIVANGSADIFFAQADSFSVKVTANEEVFEHLNYRVEDGVLIIGTKDNKPIRAEKYDVSVTLPLLEAITVNGASDVNQMGEYKADNNLTVSVNGAGDLNLDYVSVPVLSFTLNGASDLRAKDLDVQELKIGINGAGDAVLAGKADKAHFSVNGAGDIDARGLVCGEVTTHKAGAARIQLSK